MPPYINLKRLNRNHLTPKMFDGNCLNAKNCFTYSLSLVFNSNKIKKQALFSSVLLLLSVPAYAQVDDSISSEFSGYSDTRQNNSHAYVGLRGGGTHLEGACSSNSSECNDNTFGYGLYGGYQFISWFALEVAVTNYGTPDASYGLNNVSADILGSELTGVFSYDLSESFDAYARVGVAYQSIDKNSTGESELTSNEWGVVSALGVDYRLSRDWSVRGEYQFINGIGNAELMEADMDFVSLGLTYHFGQKKELIVATTAVIRERFIRTKTTLQTRAWFDFNSSIININPELTNIVVQLLQTKEGDIEVIGYADSLGSEKYNKWLSEKRAQAIADYLVKEGVNYSRLIVKGEGELFSIAGNETAEGRAQNRRVKIKFEKISVKKVQGESLIDNAKAQQKIHVNK